MTCVDVTEPRDVDVYGSRDSGAEAALGVGWPGVLASFCEAGRVLIFNRPAPVFVLIFISSFSVLLSSSPSAKSSIAEH